jgi:hypothetical protein
MRLPLQIFLERHPPYSNLGAIDVDLYADALVAVYRHSPQRSQRIIRTWLEPQRSEAVKLCVVRAAMTLVVETAVFPWQPSLTPMLQVSTKRLNLILRVRTECFMILVLSADVDRSVPPA